MENMNEENFKKENLEELDDLFKERYEDLVASSSDYLFAFVLIVVGFLFWLFYSVGNLGVGMYIFTLFLSASTLFYLNAKGFNQNKKSLTCLALLLVLTTVFLLFDNEFEKFLNDIFIKFVFVYWVILTTKNTTDKELSTHTMTDILHQMFFKGFSNFLILPTIIKKKSKNAGNFLPALLGLLVMLPVLLVVISLLVSADAMFKSLVSSASDVIITDLFSYLLKFILGIPIAFYLYSLIWGNLTKDDAKNPKMESKQTLNKLSFVPSVTVHTALSALNFIYILFFISQSAYLFSAFNSVLPEGMTYAEYARSGFFELCYVVVINLFVIVTAYLLIKKPATKGLNIQAGLLSLFTLLLIMTSMSKMFLYIQTYGLTTLRVYISLFMLMLFVIFLAVLVRQFLKFNVARAIIITITLFFTVLCYGNVDGQIAKYNISGYLSQDLKLMDEAFMDDLSDAATPYLYEGYKKAHDNKDTELLREVIFRKNDSEATFKNFNFQKNRGDQIRKELSEKVSS